MLLSDLQPPVYRDQSIRNCQERRLSAHQICFQQMGQTACSSDGNHKMDDAFDSAFLCQWYPWRKLYWKYISDGKNEYYTSVSVLQQMEEISVGGNVSTSNVVQLRNKSAHRVIKVMTSEKLASQEDYWIECLFLCLKNRTCTNLVSTTYFNIIFLTGNLVTIWKFFISYITKDLL